MKERQFKTRKARKQAMRARRSTPYANQRIRTALPLPKVGFAIAALAMLAGVLPRKNKRGR